MRWHGPHPAPSEGNIAAVAASVRKDREESIRRRSQQLGLSYAITWPILRKDLGLQAYKIQLVQELKLTDFPKRFRFGRWALDKLAEDPQSLLTDEPHFWLNEYGNKQN